MDKKIILIAIIAVILSVVGFRGLINQSTNQGVPTKQETTNKGYLNLSFKDYSGKTISLADYSGKPLIINAWASWCPFCTKELPDFVSLKRELGDKVVIVAIDRGESVNIAKQYSDSLGVTNDLIFLVDPDDSFYKTIGGFSMPETIFVDKNGVIKIHKRGPMELDEMREKAKSIL